MITSLKLEERERERGGGGLLMNSILPLGVGFLLLLEWRQGDYGQVQIQKLISEGHLKFNVLRAFYGDWI